jgi:hypothetical protein
MGSDILTNLLIKPVCHLERLISVFGVTEIKSPPCLFFKKRQSTCQVKFPHPIYPRSLLTPGPLTVCCLMQDYSARGETLRLKMPPLIATV